MKNDDIKIEYNEVYPTLCMGELIVWIGNKKYNFPSYCLSSGGSVSFDENWIEQVDSGPWTIREWPKYFPEEYKKKVLKKINKEIKWGCCGGCV